MSVDKISNLIFDALDNGVIVGSTGKGKNVRSVYEVNFDGQIQTIAIAIGGNGFIVTAHPF